MAMMQGMGTQQQFYTGNFGPVSPAASQFSYLPPFNQMQSHQHLQMTQMESQDRKQEQ